MYTIGNLDEHLVGMGHTSTLNKVRNKEAMYQRAASVFSLKHKSLEQIRTMPLASTVHDDFNNYALPTDFGTIIDLFPEANRTVFDKAFRTDAGTFDLEKATKNKLISIEGDEGIKTIRIDWRSRQGKVLSTMNDVDDNGTWAAVNGTTGIQQDIITYMTGNGSVRFDLAASGDGIKNTTLSSVDLTDEDEVADVFVYLYFPTVANLQSIFGLWGNNLTAKYWTSVSQTTQADGSAFKAGWNLVRFPWATATETGVVAPATINSFELSFVTTGAIANVRADNVVFSIGRAFDIKYYSKCLFKDSTTSAYITKPNYGSSDDFVLIDEDTLPAFLMELLVAMAHQVEGVDSTFDLNFAMGQLKEIYPILKSQTPSMVKRQIGRTTSGPRVRRFGQGRRY